jgi:hypothetical protein
MYPPRSRIKEVGTIGSDHNAKNCPDDDFINEELESKGEFLDREGLMALVTLSFTRRESIENCKQISKCMLPMRFEVQPYRNNESP